VVAGADGRDGTRDRRQQSDRPLDRVRLRRPGRAGDGRAADRRRRPPGRRDRRGGDRVAPVRAPPPGSGSAHPHLGGIADLKLPALAAGVLGARLPRHAVARLRTGRASRRGRRVRAPAPALRRPMTSGISRILVGVAGLPVVLGILWLGGWWLFVLA